MLDAKSYNAHGGSKSVMSLIKFYLKSVKQTFHFYVLTVLV